MKNNCVRVPRVKKNVHGVLLLDKSQGYTSNGALQKVKFLFSAKKAGHTGSLDPLATGMLPICFGEATKISGILLESKKKYEVEITLGVTTSTGDTEGEMVLTRPVPELNTKILSGLEKKFTGEQFQIPPMFSAIKIQGRPLYELARQGIEIERAPRKICIESLSIQMKKPDVLALSVHCSKGTYVRSLAQDIGEALGCGAHVSALRRSWVAPFHDQSMISLEALEALLAESGEVAILNWVKPISEALTAFPLLQLDAASAFYFKQGQSVQTSEKGKSGMVQLLHADGSLMGIGLCDVDGCVHPKRLFSV